MRVWHSPERSRASGAHLLSSRPHRSSRPAGPVILVAALAFIGTTWALGLRGVDPTQPDPIPSTVPPSTPGEPVIVDSPAEMPWTFDVDDALLENVMPWRGRLLGVVSQSRCSGCSTLRRLFVSIDGFNWNPAPVQPPVTRSPKPGSGVPSIADAAVFEGSVYVVDDRTEMPEGHLLQHPSVWASADLEEWRRVPVEISFAAGPTWDGLAVTNAGLVLSGRGSEIWALSDGRFAVLESPP